MYLSQEANSFNFQEYSSRKTVIFEEQIMSKDNPSIFGGNCVYYMYMYLSNMSCNTHGFENQGTYVYICFVA